MKSTPCDAYRGALTAEGIVLEFGQAQDGPAGEVDVRLTDRIVLSPEAARRLSLSLDAALQKRVVFKPELPTPALPTAADSADETTAPEIGVQIPRTEGTKAEDRASVRGRTPVNAPSDPAAEQASQLLRLVGELGIPFQHERSLQIARGSISANRYLLTINKADLPSDAFAATMAICREMNMPEGLYEIVREKFDTANCIHFGFEGGQDRIIVKLYLERAINNAERSKSIASGSPVLLHLAYKWEISSGDYVTTRYHWYPQASESLIRDRIREVYSVTSSGGEEEGSLAIALQALGTATGKIPADRLQYLEVLEDENQRRSFDLNLYEAGLMMKDIQPILVSMRDSFDVSKGHFQAVYDQVKNRGLGHLAGGIHRDGADFFNLYYGVQGYPRFSEGA